MSRPTAWLCDFDGTVAPTDVGASLVRRFGIAEGEERRALDAALARWRAGEIGHRELTEAECAWMRVGETEARDFVRGFTLDPAFAAFVRSARARGDVVGVLSEGFEFYIDLLLEQAGLADVPRAANRARFEGDRMHPEFPHLDPSCGVCGNCKGRHVREHRTRGYRVVMVGDGYSDRCGARAADAVLARGHLLEWCRRHGVAAEPFEDFADVARRADGVPARPGS